MKQWYETEVVCPYCHKKVKYNILTSFFHARVECPHCEYGLIVRFNKKFTTKLLLFGLIPLVLFDLFFQPNLTILQRIVIALVWVFSLDIVMAMTSVKKKGAQAVYFVDMEDPTVLFHKKKINK